MTVDSIGRYPSPLRYPGGKGKLTNYLKLVLLSNSLVGHEYVEPYTGGGSVALSLLYEDYVSRIHINDLNPGVHAVWSACLYDSDRFCGLIADVPISMDEWRRQKAIYRSGTATGIELAFATFFLNRTNRSGIVSGGPIGGVDQTGAWLLDARFNRDALIARVEKIARHRSRINLSNCDAVQLLELWCKSGQRDAFLYLDPPYYVKGGRLYDNFYTHADHEAVAEVVSRLQHPWMVSYDAAPEILDLYRWTDSLEYSLSYSLAGAGSGDEVIFCRNDISLPGDGVSSPAGVRAPEVSRMRKAVYGAAV